MLAAETAAQDTSKLKKVLSLKNLPPNIVAVLWVENKKIASMKVLGDMKDHYKKLSKDANTPKKEYKKWTEVDRAKLTKAMSNHVELSDTALVVEKNNHWKKQKLMFLAMMKKGTGCCNGCDYSLSINSLQD